MSFRCLIVDDSPEFVEAARVLLEREGVAIVGVASTIAEALELSQAVEKDVTLIDVNLGDESGFELAELLARSSEAGRAPLVLISTRSGDDYADLVEMSPAVGFLPKSDISAQAIIGFIDGTPKGD
jgi:DNA-binding NarL/FixJ family response regulator